MHAGVINGGSAGPGPAAGPFPGHPILPGFGGTPLNGRPTQSPGFLKMQSPDLDTGACWFDHDVGPASLSVVDIFGDDPAAKF
jgi:hypothetical protein